MQLTRAVRAGLLRRMVHGLYVAADVPDSIRLRCAGLTLVLPDDAFICDRTAAWLYTGARSLGPNENLSVPPISFFRPSSKRSRLGATTRAGERAVIDEDLTEVHGLRVTTELRTASDLGRLETNRDLRLWGMDNLLSTAAFTLDELIGTIPRFKGERGVVGLRTYAPLARTGSQSFGESALRLRWYDAGLAEPILQCPVTLSDGTTYFLDMADGEQRFAAEYDGAEWHSTPDQRAHDEYRRGRLADEGRWEIEVFRREHVFGKQQDAQARLRSSARRARASVGLRSWTL